MPRSIVGQTSNDCNEVSVSSQSAEHLRASDSSQRAEQPSSEDSVEQFRLSAWSQIAEQDRSSFDDIVTDIQRPPRSRGESPTSIDSASTAQVKRHCGKEWQVWDLMQNTTIDMNSAPMPRKRYIIQYNHTSNSQRTGVISMWWRNVGVQEIKWW